jgi:hypothetical protein
MFFSGMRLFLRWHKKRVYCIRTPRRKWGFIAEGIKKAWNEGNLMIDFALRGLIRLHRCNSLAQGLASGMAFKPPK